MPPWSLRCPEGHASLRHQAPHQDKPYRCMACGDHYGRRDLEDLAPQPELDPVEDVEGRRERERQGPTGGQAGPSGRGSAGERAEVSGGRFRS